MKIKLIITVILLLIHIQVFAQEKGWKERHIKMSMLKEAGHLKIWELVPMNSGHVYFMYIILADKKTSKQDKKMYLRLIRTAKHKKPDGLYFIFQKRELYPIDTSSISNSGSESSLIIEEKGLKPYLEGVEILNPSIKGKLLKKQVLIFNVKKNEESVISDY